MEFFLRRFVVPAVALLLIGLSAQAQIAPRGPSPGAGRPSPPGARGFSVARLKYGGGGDWYEDRTSIVNLLRALTERTSIPVAGEREAVVEPASASLFQFPFLFTCGHGNIKFSPTEVA